MNATAPALMRIEELYALREDGMRHELVQGRLVSEPPPGGRHGRIAARLVQRLGAHVEAHDLGVVLTCDTGFVLHRDPDTVRAPDIAFVTRARYDAYEDEAAPLPGPPDIAIEVLSPHDTLAAVHAKVADYLAAGTSIVWVVDPDELQVRSYRKLLEPSVFDGTDELTADELLPGFVLPVGELFAR